MTQPICIHCGKTEGEHQTEHKWCPVKIRADQWSDAVFTVFIPEKEPAVEDDLFSVETKNIPEKIYLQISEDDDTPEDFKELHGISWCEDRINKSDLEYVRAGELTKLREDKQELVEGLKRLYDAKADWNYAPSDEEYNEERKASEYAKQLIEKHGK